MHQDFMTTTPMWKPSEADKAASNLQQVMNHLGFDTVPAFHAWTVTEYDSYWQYMVERLGIKFDQKSSRVSDLSEGIESPKWFPDATMNIADSCFNAPPAAIAIRYWDESNHLCQLSYHELNQLANRIANSLIAAGFKQGDAIGIAMPMNYHAVAIYLGIIKMGGVVVSIADSFSTQEIQTRLDIANAAAIFTQDYTLWNGKHHPLHQKIVATTTKTIIIVTTANELPLTTRTGVLRWDAFLVDNTAFDSVKRNPMTPCHILFSSGTTSAPKAIVWNQITPVKAASDACLHQNIKAGDVLCWPTNLGWMMGPWLIFAALINQASIALYTDVPKDRHFGEFVENAKVTMLGVVPTLVASWRQSKCMEGLDWHLIKVFSSTGECSNPGDMQYLSELAGGKPVIEYCGGTEVGGAYLSSTVIEDNYPSLFTTLAMGINIQIMNEDGQASDHGEVAIIPPAIGLSTRLLNADHHKIYYADMPVTIDGHILRRHGDEIIRLKNGLYTVLGRADDTMNLGGIKISSAEIERTIAQHPDIFETAAVAVNPPGNGPAQLVIFAAATKTLNKQTLKMDMQALINKHLNPLFKIHDLIIVKELPKTASNKIMRRVLRADYMEKIR